MAASLTFRGTQAGAARVYATSGDSLCAFRGTLGGVLWW
jgi:hypothetical protein